MSEQMVGIAVKLYDCRRTALSVLGPEKFKVKVAEYRTFIEYAMAKHDCDEIRATMKIAEMIEKGGYDGWPTILAFATCVEMLEPTPGL